MFGKIRCGFALNQFALNRFGTAIGLPSIGLAHVTACAGPTVRARLLLPELTTTFPPFHLPWCRYMNLKGCMRKFDVAGEPPPFYCCPLMPATIRCSQLCLLQRTLRSTAAAGQRRRVGRRVAALGRLS